MIRLQLQLELAYTVLPPGADFFFYIHAARTAHQVVPYENLTISQSGETADTLAALRHAQSLGMEHTLTICNVATSAMVRECKLSYITRAGMEIGVASTKAFTTQLAGLFLLTLALGQSKGQITEAQSDTYLEKMRHLPVALQAVLALEPQVVSWAEDFARKQNALFLGRGIHYPIALEGALKLKEISYIHAEAYPAGELKHGPLALVDSEMPVVTVALDCGYQSASAFAATFKRSLGRSPASYFS